MAQTEQIDDNGNVPEDRWGCKLVSGSAASDHFEIFWNNQDDFNALPTDCLAANETCSNLSLTKTYDLWIADSTTPSAMFQECENPCREGTPDEILLKQTYDASDHWPSPERIPWFYECVYQAMVEGIDAGDDAYLFPDPLDSRFFLIPPEPGYRFPIWVATCYGHDPDNPDPLDYDGRPNGFNSDSLEPTLIISPFFSVNGVSGCSCATPGGIDSTAFHEEIHLILQGITRLFNRGMLKFIHEGMPSYVELMLSYHLDDPGRLHSGGDSMIAPIPDFERTSLRKTGYTDAAIFWYFLASRYSSYAGTMYDDADLPWACIEYSSATGEELGPDGTTPEPWLRRLPGRDVIWGIQDAFSNCYPDGPTVDRHPYCNDETTCLEDFTYFCDVGEHARCEDGAPACYPRQDFDDDDAENAIHDVNDSADDENFRGEDLMPLVMSLIDETLAGNPTFDDDAADGIKNVAFRHFLERDYLHRLEAQGGNGAAADTAADDPYTIRTEFRIKSFGASYHEFDMDYIPINGDMRINIDVSYGSGAFPAGGSYMPVGTEVWLTAVYPYFNPVTLEWELVEAIPWFQVAPYLIEGDDFVVQKIAGYDRVAIIMTAFEGTFVPGVEMTCAPNDDDEECLDDGECFACSGGIYTIAPDTDGDGVLDDADNCVYVPNPDQENCDEDDDDREVVNLWMRGDACDPDLCIGLTREPRDSHTLVVVADGHATVFFGAASIYHIKSVGAVAANPSEKANRFYLPEHIPGTTYYTADVAMSHCECEPDPGGSGECNEPILYCNTKGSYGLYSYYDSSWSLEDHLGDWDYGEGGNPHEGDQMLGMLFARPGHHGNANVHDVIWRWDDDYGAEVDARIWLRPDPAKLRAAWGSWPDERGNTYSKVVHHESHGMSVLWVPADLIHGYPPNGISSMSRYADVLSEFVEFPLGCSPWCDLRGDPFELPSVMTAGYSFSSPLKTSRYALKSTTRAALSAIMVRHQKTSTSFVSEYVPLAFSGNEQLDLDSFASTAMIQTPTGPAQDFNDALTLWTFGGKGRTGVYYNELWRGWLDRSGNDPVYRFARIPFSTGPTARYDAMLMADTSGQRLVMMGGWTTKTQTDVWVYTISSNKWSKKSVTPPSGVGLAKAAWFVAGHQAYIYGGLRANGSFSNELWRFDLHSYTFTKLPGNGGTYHPAARVWSSLSIDQDGERLYLYGGRNSSSVWTNELAAYDIANDAWTVVSPSCQAGAACPPAAVNSAILQSGDPDSVTMGLGTPTVQWSGTDHEWRWVLWQNRWVKENEARNAWQYQQ